MADDKSKTGRQDRERVAGDQDYEVLYLVETTGITRAEALDLIQEHGNDRDTLMREAKKLGR